MKKKALLLIVISVAMALTTNASAQDVQDKRTEEKWDKVFPLSETVNHRKVEFKNQYGITLVGDLYTPKSEGNRMALAVCGPFGASKEQSSGLYAMKMAERGFVACAFDPSFTGEVAVSPGALPRLTSIPKISWRLWISFPACPMSMRRR